MLLAWLVACHRTPLLEAIEVPEDHAALLPLVVAVHGLGDRPESLLALVERCELPVRIVAPRGPDRIEGGFGWFGFATAAESEAGILRSTDRLAALIDELRRTRPTVGEPVIMGFSQGGILSFAVALRHPESVGTAVPLAGALPMALVPAGAPPADRPTIHAFHGRQDRVLALAPTEALVRTLTEAGWSVDLTVFDDVGHSVPQPMHEAACRALAAATGTR